MRGTGSFLVSITEWSVKISIRWTCEPRREVGLLGVEWWVAHCGMVWAGGGMPIAWAGFFAFRPNPRSIGPDGIQRGEWENSTYDTSPGMLSLAVLEPWPILTCFVVLPLGCKPDSLELMETAASELLEFRVRPKVILLFYGAVHAQSELLVALLFNPIPLMNRTQKRNIEK